MIRHDLRNIAIIAHVDHGKTTLVDGMLKQTGTFRDNQQVRTCVMDSGDLERERGITILAKNTSIHWKGIKINMIDTPGHADFSGEVERVLKMVSGVLLLVDASEGPMPQTRFVVEKALELDLKIIIIVNKVDRPDARTDQIGDEVLELFLDLGAGNSQFDSPIIFCSGKNSTASLSFKTPGKDLTPLFDTIVNYIEPPEGDEKGDLQLLVSAIDYNEYVGRIGIGRIERGSITANSDVMVCDYMGAEAYKSKIVNLFQIEGLNRVPISTASVGDIVCFSGSENINIGNTICAMQKVEPVPFIKIGEPTIEMNFSVNDGPFAGREGKFVTSRKLRERLFHELLKDVSLRVTETDTADTFKVAGRGEMHISILMETMRREGYEFCVSSPQVIYKTIDGKKCEPMERLFVDVPVSDVGSVMERMGARRGELLTMTPQGSRIKMEFMVPERGLFGFKNEFLTDTKGEGVVNQLFGGYAEYKGIIPRRHTGSLIAFETGEATTYGLYGAQERGVLFVDPQTPVYEGMVVGVSPKAEDIRVNVCKKKHVTNMRASGTDDALRLSPPKKFSLEESLEFLNDDEMMEITPKSIRIRKIYLSENERRKAFNREKAKNE